MRPWVALAALFLASVAPHVRAEDGTLGPCDLTASADGQQLYVACADAREVVWVSIPDGEVLRRVTVPCEPTGIAITPDGKRLVVTCAAPQSVVVVLDTQSGQTVQTIPVGHTAVSPIVTSDGRRLYVCNRFDDDVSVIDLAAGVELARIRAVRQPIAAALTPDGARLLVANHLFSTRADLDFRGSIAAMVTVIDTATYETTNIGLPHGASSLRGICVTPDGNYAFVTHLLSNFESVPFRVDTGWINVNVVSVLDLREMKRFSTIGLDAMLQGSANPWGITCSPDGTRVCVVSAGTHELSVIPTADLVGEVARRTMSPLPGAWPVYPSLGDTMWKRAALPGKGARTVVVVAGLAYVAEYFSDSIAVVEWDNLIGGPVKSMPLGPSREPSLQRRGQQLFEDATLCYQHWQSCASCHPDGRVDALNWDLMNDGIGNPKNSKSMLLSHVTPPAMVTGVRATAEVAVRTGLAHILFAHQSEEPAIAMDAYLKTLKPVPSPYLVAGRLSDAAQRGERLFVSERVGCSNCHPAPLFTDMKVHRMGRTNSRRFENLFDTPTLVEVWRTAPYLHAGQYATIRDLLHEGKHGLGADGGEALTEQELDDLIEFVLSL